MPAQGLMENDINGKTFTVWTNRYHLLWFFFETEMFPASAGAVCGEGCRGTLTHPSLPLFFTSLLRFLGHKPDMLPARSILDHLHW